MEPDLWLTIVPAEFEPLMEKAKKDHAYAGWLAFTDVILKGNDLSEFDDAAALAVIRDVLKLKNIYHYTHRDFFYDTNRCTSTLDYLLDHEIDLRNPEIYHGMIREAGSEIDDHCAGGHGIPLKIYSPNQIEMINELMSKIDFSDLAKHYDDEKPVAFGVHRLQSGNQEDVAHAFTQIKSLFKRALHHPGTCILKKID